MIRSEEHTSELQSPCNLVCRLLLEKKKKIKQTKPNYSRHHSDLREWAGSRFSVSFFFFFFRGALAYSVCSCRCSRFFFFFNDTATTEIYTLSLHDALPIYRSATWPPRSTSARGSRCAERT